MERRKFTREFKLEAVRLIKRSAGLVMRRPRKTWGCIRPSFAAG
jgi:transposase-like protein